MNTGFYNTIMNRVPRTKAAATTVANIADAADVSASTARKYVTAMVECGDVQAHPIPGYGDRFVYSRESH